MFWLAGTDSVLQLVSCMTKMAKRFSLASYFKPSLI